MIAQRLDNFTYENLLESALERVPNTVDKREGSIIFDALAPVCAELAQAYIQLKSVIQETYVLTATAENLDLRVAEEGLARFSATSAVKRGIFKDGMDRPKEIPIGNRFSTIGMKEDFNYVVTEQITDDEGRFVDGAYLLSCEKKGKEGNGYIGKLLPITPINDLGSAFMDELLMPARDQEPDDELRARYQEKVDVKSFGGNLSQYDQWIRELKGVGEVQIYPTWNGGGTVKCSIIGVDYNPASTTLLEEVQQAVDPDNMTPQGIGLGIAPIGHKVTVVTATPVPMNINANISLSSGYDKGQVLEKISESINEYLLDVRKKWGSPDDYNKYSQNVFISQINFAILSVMGVANVTGTTINGKNMDIVLKEDASVQQIPVVGTVIINAG